MFSLLRSTRALALKPTLASRLPANVRCYSRALNGFGASATSVTPYGSAALVSAYARFFATSRAVGAAAAHKDASEASEDGEKKKGTKKKAAAKAKKSKAKAKADKGVKARKPVKKAAPKPKRIFVKEIKPPFPYPGSSWINFVREAQVGRPADKSARTVMHEASKQWKEMSAEEKQKYAPSREAVAEFQAKKTEWYKALPRLHRAKYRERHQKPKQQGRPSAFSLYTKEVYPTAEGANFTEKVKNIAEAYRNLSDAERESYKQKAMEIKAVVERTRAATRAATEIESRG